MSQRVLNSQATAVKRQFYFYVISATTLGPLTGITWSASNIQVSKNGGSGANSGGSVTQIDATNLPGAYFYTALTTEIGTDGNIQLCVSPAGGISRTYNYSVVEVDDYDNVRQGMTALPNAVASAAGGLLTVGTGAGQIHVDGTTGAVDANPTKWSGTAVTTPVTAGQPVVDVSHPTITVGTGTNGVLTFSLNTTLSQVNQLEDQWLCWRAGSANYYSGLPPSHQIASNDASTPSNVTLSKALPVAPNPGDVADLIGK